MLRWLNLLGRHLLRESRRSSYRLAVPMDYGKGQVVVLLHGIAGDHRLWRNALPHISDDCRVVGLDLLGFGDSPKPDEPEYSVRDHAQAVIATLAQLKIRKNIVLAGHSMGSLVAVEIARQEPRLVGRLVLCSPPIYRFDEKHRLRRNQITLFTRVARLAQREKIAMRTLNGFKKLRPDLKGFGLTKATWIPFKKSLQHTVMEQTTYADIQDLDLPVDMICGRFDSFIIKRHLHSLTGSLSNVSLQWLNEPHEITKRYGKRIGQTINSALT